MARRIAGCEVRRFVGLKDLPFGSDAHAIRDLDQLREVPRREGESPPPPGPRLYSGPDDPRFANLRRRLDEEWAEMIRTALGLKVSELPLIWDADFFFGEPAHEADDRYVLCEIKVSSVAPFPDSAIPPLVEAARRRLA